MHTGIGDTTQLAFSGVVLNDLETGVCASACAYAFLGGIERSTEASKGSKLGVHQFYSKSSKDISSADTQIIVGKLLFYLNDMGISSQVLVMSSTTNSDRIYWLNKEETIAWGVDNTGSRSENWKIEPYKSGLVLTTRFLSGASKIVFVSLFCRKRDGVFRLLVSQDAQYAVNQMDKSSFINANSPPELVLSGESYALITENIEAFRIADPRFFLRCA